VHPAASGTLACTSEPFHVLIGFFNAGTLNEWRTPNTIALRLSGRGGVFYAWLEYATARWRAGGDSPQPFPTETDPRSGRSWPKGFPTKGAVYRWSLAYDPKGNNGAGISPSGKRWDRIKTASWPTRCLRMQKREISGCVYVLRQLKLASRRGNSPQLARVRIRRRGETRSRGRSRPSMRRNSFLPPTSHKRIVPS
jgi:hypothetical protein